ncbi:hemoglobin [Methylobacillus rhizosphaerae]|uniref:Hemoglobin n=1 Tax=Methylobacillus rhizosphaerae TaxID=551994 RepID=A0A238XPD9_9PROT|nr:group II truncated hemoglobin [Methylobacillus rhizosphaerae]SNR60845.1 hemoglobin [Methylobacillus rhizosphaerae]
MNPSSSSVNHPSAMTHPSYPVQKTGSLYNRVGGETGLRKLIETFYDIIEFEPQGRMLHLLHLKGHGVAHSRIEQFNFLSGFLGGPQLYIEKYRHSNVRDMHVHVEIDAAARDSWLECMLVAIDRVGLPTDVKDDLMSNLTRVAFQLQNKD